VLSKERKREEFIADALSMKRETDRALKSFLALKSFQRSKFTATNMRMAIFEPEEILRRPENHHA
jgi:hypothetical protein